MTCYMRHMDWLFEALELTSDKEQRRRVDTAIREVLELPDGVHCPEVWAALKVLDGSGRVDLAARIRARLVEEPTLRPPLRPMPADVAAAPAERGALPWRPVRRPPEA